MNAPINSFSDWARTPLNVYERVYKRYRPFRKMVILFRKFCRILCQKGDPTL